MLFKIKRPEKYQAIIKALPDYAELQRPETIAEYLAQMRNISKCPICQFFYYNQGTECPRCFSSYYKIAVAEKEATDKIWAVGLEPINVSYSDYERYKVTAKWLEDGKITEAEARQLIQEGLNLIKERVQKAKQEQRRWEEEQKRKRDAEIRMYNMLSNKN